MRSVHCGLKTYATSCDSGVQAQVSGGAKLINKTGTAFNFRVTDEDLGAKDSNNDTICKLSSF